MHRLIVTTLALFLCAVCASAQDDPWFARDKALHAAAGTALGAGGYGAGALVFRSTRARIGVGLGVALGAGAAKEWHDRGGRGTPSWRDFAWDGIGAAAGVGVAWLFDRSRHAHHSTDTARGSHSEAEALPATSQLQHLAALRDLSATAGSAVTRSGVYRMGAAWPACCSLAR